MALVQVTVSAAVSSSVVAAVILLLTHLGTEARGGHTKTLWTQVLSSGIVTSQGVSKSFVLFCHQMF